MAEDRIVAVGLLTERDLEVLGKGFNRHFPVTDESVFAELLERLQHVPPTQVKGQPDG